MTEAKWLTCDVLREMLEFLRGKSSEGKLRLFKVACCRSGWHLITDDRLRKTVEAVEAFTAGELSTEAFDAANRDGWAAWAEIADRLGSGAAMARAAQAASCTACDSAPGHNVDAYTYAVATSEALGDATGLPNSGYHQPNGKHAAILRDIVGNPFRPVAINAAWLTPAVTALTQTAHEERALPSGELDPARLAVLADALEDAGCTDADLLDHLRSPGPHVRGCWPLDLILGK
jgi:hypothetical protein